MQLLLDGERRLPNLGEQARWYAYAVPTCICPRVTLDKQVAGSTGVHSYTLPCLRTCICPRVTLDKQVAGSAGMHMPCLRAYARG